MHSSRAGAVVWREGRSSMGLGLIFRMRGTPAKPGIFDKDFLFHHALASELERAVAGIPGNRLWILDVGSRARPYQTMLEGRFQRFVALDVPPASPELDIIASAEDMPIRSGCVDVCLCTQVLEHVERPAVVIAELARVLKPGGTLLLSTHGVFHHHPFPHDYWRWTQEGLEKIVLEGFRAVEVRPNGGTILLLFHIIGRGILFVAERRRWLKFLQYTLYPVANLAGLLFGCVIRESAISINYLAIARK